MTAQPVSQVVCGHQPTRSEAISCWIIMTLKENLQILGNGIVKAIFQKPMHTQHKELFFFDQSISNPLVYGLTNSHCQNFENWGENDTQHVLSIICDAWNCESNAFGYSLADYDSRLDFPQGKPSKSAWDV